MGSCHAGCVTATHLKVTYRRKRRLLPCRSPRKAPPAESSQSSQAALLGTMTAAETVTPAQGAWTPNPPAAGGSAPSFLPPWCSPESAVKRRARLNPSRLDTASRPCPQGGWDRSRIQPCPGRWHGADLQVRGAGTDQPLGQEQTLGLRFSPLTAALLQVPAISPLAHRKPNNTPAPQVAA